MLVQAGTAAPGVRLAGVEKLSCHLAVDSNGAEAEGQTSAGSIHSHLHGA